MASSKFAHGCPSEDMSSARGYALRQVVQKSGSREETGVVLPVGFATAERARGQGIRADCVPPLSPGRGARAVVVPQIRRGLPSLIGGGDGLPEEGGSVGEIWTGWEWDFIMFP